MTLPDDFEWKTPHGALGPDTLLEHRGVAVVQMHHGIDGVWRATLGRYQFPADGLRVCTGYDQGRSGAETWVCRHQARLRADVDKIVQWREAVRGNRLLKESLPHPFP